MKTNLFVLGCAYLKICVTLLCLKLAFAQVDDVEYDTLIDPCVVHGKVKPHASAGVARVGSDIQIIFKLVDEVDAAKVAGLEGGVEAQMTAFRFSALPGRPNHQSVEVPHPTLTFTVVAI